MQQVRAHFTYFICIVVSTCKLPALCQDVEVHQSVGSMSPLQNTQEGRQQIEMTEVKDRVLQQRGGEGGMHLCHCDEQTAKEGNPRRCRLQRLLHLKTEGTRC